MAVMLFLSIVLSSCEKSFVSQREELNSHIVSYPKPKESVNPYSLKIMRQALDSLMVKTKSDVEGEGAEMDATDYYVRICPMDTASISALMNMDVELFDYPLDCEYEDDAEFYYDPDTLDENNNDWFYTAISSEYELVELPYDNNEDEEEPEDTGSYPEYGIIIEGGDTVIVEMIDSCYIPDHDIGTKSISKFRVSPHELEAMAYHIAGVEYHGLTTKTSTNTQGHVYYSENESEVLPIKGVKVRVQKFVAWSTTYTDSNGHFAISRNWNKPNISILFDNVKGFTIWGNWAFLAPAAFTTSSCSNPGAYYKRFKRQDNYPQWSWAAVNNATYDYYEKCAHDPDWNGINTPPDNLKIWCFRMDAFSGMSSAPMFKHLTTTRSLTSTPTVIDVLNFVGWRRLIPSSILLIINCVLPDLFINTYDCTNSDIISTMFHELSHASHFRKLGELNYVKLMTYEITNQLVHQEPYGTTTTNAIGEEICEVAETYAYSISNHRMKLIPNEPQQLFGTGNFFGKYVLIITELLNYHTLEPRQIFSCLGRNTSSMDEVLNNLCISYPDKSEAIQETMQSHGL